MNAYLFDVDGVITDPVRREITRPEIITVLINKLQSGSSVGLLSGRGLIWLRSKVVKVLENYLDDHPAFDRKILDNLFVSGEFGGVCGTHVNGERQESVNQDFSLPTQIRSQLTIKAEAFEKYVFVDQEKQTQFTLEANFDQNVNMLDDHGEEIAASFQELIKDYPQLEVQVDRLAINVRNKNANKEYEIKQFLKWLSEKGLHPEKYYVFGGSPTDLEMGDELLKENLPFTFVYVGMKEELPAADMKFPVTVTNEHFDAGTLEYLASLRSDV